jgi:predicted nuclease of predicted toxin-antitoxin system
VRFLVDAQLPPALARYLTAAGHQAEHVSDLGLEKASDREIWSKAADFGSTIITKDEDFLTLRALQSHGPAIVWVRVGNTTRGALIEVISSVLPAIITALERGETVVEVARL